MKIHLFQFSIATFVIITFINILLLNNIGSGSLIIGQARPRIGLFKKSPRIQVLYFYE